MDDRVAEVHSIASKLCGKVATDPNFVSVDLTEDVEQGQGGRLVHSAIAMNADDFLIPRVGVHEIYAVDIADDGRCFLHCALLGVIGGCHAFIMPDHAPIVKRNVQTGGGL
jgi:hypothetical protein